MKTSHLLGLLLPASASSFLIPPTLQNLIPASFLPTNPDQHPIMPQSPSSHDLRPSLQSEPQDPSVLTISDILPTHRAIQIFAGLTRDVESIASRLSSSPGVANTNTTLLAPLNSAMQDLPRKPWESPPDQSSDGNGKVGNVEDQAAKNIRRFVENHVVPVSPWDEGKKVKTLGGTEVWWELRGEGEKKKVVLPGEVVVEGVVGSVGNGEVWSVGGVVNYEV